MVILVIAALGQAMIYGFVLIPPWQTPDEPGHYEYVRALAEHGLGGLSSDERMTIQGEILGHLQHEQFWTFLQQRDPGLRPRVYLPTIGKSIGVTDDAARPEEPRRSFLEDRYLSSQLADEPFLYYLVPAALTRVTTDISGQLYLARGWSVLLYVLSVVFVLLGLRDLGGGDWFVPVVGGTVAALAPMPAFVGSSCNNDVAAMAASAITLWLLVKGTQQGWTPRKVLALGAILLVAALSKKTTTYLWPLALLVLMRSYRASLQAWICRRDVLLPIMACTILLAFWGTLPSDGVVSAWFDPEIRQNASRTQGLARTGSYALQINPSVHGTSARLIQHLSYNQAARYQGRDLELTVWVTGDHGGEQGFVRVYDGTNDSRQTFRLSESDWTHVAVRHQVAQEADRLTVVLGNTAKGRLLFDDLSLKGLQGEELLRNGGAERAASHFEMLSARRRVISPGLLPDLFARDSFNLASLMRYGLYVGLTFAGFWANFGWLTVPLRPYWYVAILSVCLAAGFGLIRFRLACGGRRSPLKGMWIMVLALLLICIQTFLPMIGSAWQPQGRYLFPALMPISALLALGWRELATPQARPALATLLIVGMISFGQLCIWGYLIPRYAEAMV